MRSLLSYCEGIVLAGNSITGRGRNLRLALFTNRRPGPTKPPPTPLASGIELDFGTLFQMNG
jgi:hypothetical protein